MRPSRSASAEPPPSAEGGLRERLAGTSLRWRLTAWIAVVMLLSTGITFIAVYRGTGAQLRHQIDHELQGDAGEFSRALATSDDRSPRRVAEAATRYVRAQPFSASSTLLFAIVPGMSPSTNRPELFNAVKPDEGETSAGQAQESRASQRLTTAHDGYSTVHLPDIGELRLLKHTVRVPGGVRVNIGVGEPLLSVAHAQRGVAGAFILATILTLAGALLASYLIGTRVSRPLRRMAAVAAQVDAGDLHPRIHDVGSQGDEVRVLADAFNHMLDRLTDAFAGQRAFVADASHELRTPLTSVLANLELLTEELASRIAGALDLARGVGELHDRAHGPGGDEQPGDQCGHGATEHAEEQEDLHLRGRVIDIGQGEGVEERGRARRPDVELAQSDAVAVGVERARALHRLGLEQARRRPGVCPADL